MEHSQGHQHEQIRSESDPLPGPPHHQAPGKHHDPLEPLASRVAAKLEEGNFKGAVRLACSEESIADMNDKTLAALQLKHPPPHPDPHLPPMPEDSSLSPSISEEAMVKAIRSFPNGSAGGPDGLSPQHLKDLTGASAQSCCIVESPHIADQYHPSGEDPQGSPPLVLWCLSSCT